MAEPSPASRPADRVPRRAAVLALAALALVLAGCVAAPTASPGRADPATDRRGWEAGYWHDEAIPVTNADGLNESERAAVLARTMARVEVIRDREFQRSVPVEVVDEAAVRDLVETPPPDRRRFEDVAMEAALLVGEDESAVEQGTDLVTEFGAGFYDPGADAIKLVPETGRPRLRGERVLAHELTHALQDQHADLSRTPALTDAGLGWKGVVEGDATLVHTIYQRRCEAGTWDCIEGPSRNLSAGQARAALEAGTVFLLQFQYLDGQDFAAARRAAGGWAAVDRALETPPATSSAVLHPDRAGDGPEAVDVPADPRAGWERLRPEGRPAVDRLGEATISSAFIRTLSDGFNRSRVVDPVRVANTDGLSVNRTDPLDWQLPVATGWRGDRLQVYVRDEASAYVWTSTWASPGEAREFVTGYRRLLSHWGGDRTGGATWVVRSGPFADAFHVTRRGDTVTVVNAPRRADLADVSPRPREARP